MALSSTQQQEIDTSLDEQLLTRRAVVPSLESILYQAFPVLDHGFIRVIDYMGDDSAVVQAARVSYGKGTKQLSQDQGLINYLLSHRHTTPFEMCEIKFHVKLPIFVARQWIRHRTANLNEYSARYSILGNEFYIPEPDKLAAQSRTNRQGRGNVLQGEEAAHVLNMLKQDSQNAYAHYQEMLNEDEEGNILDPERCGLARELARMNISLNFYTEWYWKIDLHNLLHFVNLRADSHAQYEIRVYADILRDIVKQWVPYTYEAFIKYRYEGKDFSRDALSVIKQWINGQTVTQESSNMSPREWRELTSYFGKEA